MEELISVLGPLTLTKVVHIYHDGKVVNVRLQNGQFLTITANQQLPYKTGDVLFVKSDQNGNSIELADPLLWNQEKWVGIVRAKQEQITIISRGYGQWEIVPTNPNLIYDVNNTVIVLGNEKIDQVFSANPLKALDINISEGFSLEKLKIKPESIPEEFEDFAGLPDVVSRTHELIELSLQKKKELEEIGVRPIKGVLFTGAPGTGKTMLARIIAKSVSATFYQISGPEIFSKWYGQSEEILRNIFEDAAKQDQAIIFFDEIDSVAGQRDESNHEESKRVVAQLLTLMDGFTTKKNVVVIAATNRPQDIDAALLRPGRFDWQINFPMPNLDDRRSILISTSKKIKGKKDLPHSLIAEKTEGWSGADLAAIWVEAALLAVAEGRQEIASEDYLGGYERVNSSKLKYEERIGA